MPLVRINRNPSARDLRQFSGVWLPLFAALAGGVSYWHGGTIQALVIWAVGSALAVVGLASPACARLVFVGLSYLTFPIGFVVSYVVLSAVFLLVVTPIALIQRVKGRDELRLKRPSSSPRRTSAKQCGKPPSRR